MRKTVLLVLALFVVFNLSACFSTFSFQSDELKIDVTKIEIIELDDYEGNLFPDSEKTYEVLVTLTNDVKDSFIEDFSLLEFKKYYGSPNKRPNGKCLKFYYSDESYAFISYYTFLKFSKDGTKYISTLNLHTSEDKFMDLIDTYTNMI
jgi:hypothetical protein